MKDNRSGSKNKFSKTLVLSMALTTSLNMSNALAQHGPPGMGGNPGVGGGHHGGQGQNGGHDNQGLQPGQGGIVPGPGSGGSGNGQSQPPQVPPKMVLDGKELERRVSDAAENFIGLIMDIYMPAHNARYNLRRGLLDTKAKMGDLDSEFSQHYLAGKPQGEKDGVEPGKVRGKGDSSTEAKRMILEDIGAEIDQAIAANGKVKFVQNPRLAKNYSVSSPLSSPRSVEERMQADPLMHSEIDGLFNLNQESSLQRDLRKSLLGDIREIMQNDKTDVPERFKDDFMNKDRAFDMWLNKDYLLNYAEIPEMNYLRHISDGNVYETPSENRENFRRGFNYAFHNGIKSPNPHKNQLGFGTLWRQMIGAEYLRAQQIGQSYYTKHAYEYMAQVGYNAGYNATYSANALKTLNESIKANYTAQYPGIEQQIRSSSVITNIDARIVPSLGKKNLGIGDFFDIVVDGAANRGLKAGTVAVEFLPSPNVNVLEKAKSFGLEGFRKLQEPITYNYMGQINDQTEPDQSLNLRASVAGVVVTATVQATFEGLVINAAKATDAGWTAHLMKKTADWMAKEWNDTSGWGDQYEKHDGRMLIVKMFNLFKSGQLTDEEMNRIRPHGQMLRDVYGEKYDNLLKKDDWKAVRGMADEIGLAGKMKGED